MYPCFKDDIYSFYKDDMHFFYKENMCPFHKEMYLCYKKTYVLDLKTTSILLTNTTCIYKDDIYLSCYVDVDPEPFPVVAELVDDQCILIQLIHLHHLVLIG